MEVREESLNHRILLDRRIDYISRLCHWSHKRLSGPTRNSCFLLFRREAKESYVKRELLERQPAPKRPSRRELVTNWKSWRWRTAQLGRAKKSDIQGQVFP